jgi:hypothetical protein
MAVERRGEPEGLVLGVSLPPLKQGQLEQAPSAVAPSRALEPAPAPLPPAVLGKVEGELGCGLGCGVLLPVALGTALRLSAGGGL